MILVWELPLITSKDHKYNEGLISDYTYKCKNLYRFRDCGQKGTPQVSVDTLFTLFSMYFHFDTILVRTLWHILQWYSYTKYGVISVKHLWSFMDTIPSVCNLLIPCNFLGLIICEETVGDRRFIVRSKTRTFSLIQGGSVSSSRWFLRGYDQNILD